MRILACLLVVALFSGCMGESFPDADGTPAGAEADGWTWSGALGEVKYRDRTIKADIQGDSLGLSFHVEEDTAGAFGVEVSGVLGPTDRPGDYFLTYAVWRDDGKAKYYYSSMYIGGVAYLKVDAGGQTVEESLSDPYWVVFEGGTGGGFRLSFSWVSPQPLEAGDWNVLFGHNRVVEMQVTITDLPVESLTQDPRITTGGCAFVRPSDFESAVSIWTYMGPFLFLDRHYDVGTEGGLYAWFRAGSGSIGMVEASITRPDGNVTGTREPVMELNAPGTYRFSVHRGAGVGVVDHMLGYCAW